MKIEYRPIAVVRSPFKEKSGTPIQSSRAKGATGAIEVFQEFAEGLSDLDGFSHIILWCHLHQSSGYTLQVVPPRVLISVPKGFDNRGELAGILHELYGIQRAI